MIKNTKLSFLKTFLVIGVLSLFFILPTFIPKAQACTPGDVGCQSNGTCYPGRGECTGGACVTNFPAACGDALHGTGGYPGYGCPSSAPTWCGNDCWNQYGSDYQSHSECSGSFACVTDYSQCSASTGTPGYACNGTSCVAQMNGSYTTSNCNNACTGSGYCGDGSCNNGETSSSCPDDCGGGGSATISGTLTPVSPTCTIASGASNCNVDLTWNVTNPENTSFVTSVGGTQVFGNSGGPRAFLVPYSGRIFWLYNYDGTNLLATSTATASCIAGTTWNSSSSTCVTNTSTATIQGFKLKMPGNQNGSVPPGGETVSVSGGPSSAANAYFLTVNAGATYTVSVTLPGGWTVQSSLCIDSNTCHDPAVTPSAFQSGTSRSVTIPSGTGHYADLWWHFTPTCTSPTTGVITAPAIAQVNSTFDVSCSYGSSSDYITVPGCTYSRWVGNTAYFSCTAPATAQSKTYTCTPANVAGNTNWCTVPSTVSKTVTISTAPTVPADPPSQTASCAAPGTTATVNWGASSGATDYGIWYYDVAVGQGGGQCGNGITCPGPQGVNARSENISTIAGHTYKWIALAANGVGWSDPPYPYGNGAAWNSITCTSTTLNGGWSGWSPSTCPDSCGQSASTLYRACNNPTPSGAGADCHLLDGGSSTFSCSAT